MSSHTLVVLVLDIDGALLPRYYVLLHETADPGLPLIQADATIPVPTNKQGIIIIIITITLLLLLLRGRVKWFVMKADPVRSLQSLGKRHFF